MAIDSQPVDGLSPVNCGIGFFFVHMPSRTNSRPSGGFCSSGNACRQSIKDTHHRLGRHSDNAALISSGPQDAKSMATIPPFVALPYSVDRAPAWVFSEYGGSVTTASTLPAASVGSTSRQSPWYSVTVLTAQSRSRTARLRRGRLRGKFAHRGCTPTFATVGRRWRSSDSPSPRVVAALATIIFHARILSHKAPGRFAVATVAEIAEGRRRFLRGTSGKICHRSTTSISAKRRIDFTNANLIRPVGPSWFLRTSSRASCDLSAGGSGSA